MTRLYVAMEDSVAVVTGRQDHWQLDVRLEGRPASCVAVDAHRADRVYCGTAGQGLWRSADAGATWVPVADGISHARVTAVAVSPLARAGANGVVWAGTEPRALFRSDDGGATWQECPGLDAVPAHVRRSAPSQPHAEHVRWIQPDLHVAGRLFVAIDRGGIMRSHDSGRTWEDCTPGTERDGHTLAMTRRAPGRLYLATGGSGVVIEESEHGLAEVPTQGGYAESADGGTTWEMAVAGLEAHHYLWSVAVDPGDPDTIVASAARSARHAHSLRLAESVIYRRTAGTAWRRVEVGLPKAQGTLIAALATHEAEPGVFYAASNRGVFRSGDAGRVWERLPVAWLERYRLSHVHGLALGPD